MRQPDDNLRRTLNDMSRAWVFVAMAIVVAPACKSFDEQKYLDEGAATVLPFKREMKAALMTGLRQGPSSAIAVCRVEAPKLAAAASVDGARVGRTSTKLRNPSNAPKEWMKPVLERYARGAAERTPTVVSIDSTTVGYIEPIYLQPLCATCHGKAIDPELLAAIEQLYPDDEATGYAPGDWRGVFWVELPR